MTQTHASRLSSSSRPGHRTHAHQRAARTTISCDVHESTRRDALLYSVSVHSTHGLRRSDADKRRAVLVLLQEDEWV